MKKTSRFHAGALILAGAFVCGLTNAAIASDDASNSASAVEHRLARDEARADALKVQVSSAADRLKRIQVADLFGPSDEEKAAAAAATQREQSQDSNIATLNQRAGDLEESLRRLTGQIEVLNHRLDEMDQRMERMRKEFDYKLCSMSAQQLGAQAGSQNALPCAQDSTPSAGVDAPPPGDTTQSTGVVRLAPPPGNLGTLPQGTPMPQAGPAPEVQSPGPNQTASVDTHAPFQAAMDLLARSQYDEARAAFRNFADTYPKDPLAAQALYWLGDVAYVQKDYGVAAHTFAEELKKFPQSPRGPESMLKLGQSLLAMNQKQEGCTALEALMKNPSASKAILSQAQAVRRAGGCRH